MVTFDPLTESLQQNLPAFVQHNEAVQSEIHESFKGGSEFITMPTDSTNLEHTPASIPQRFEPMGHENLLQTQNELERKARITVNLGFFEKDKQPLQTQAHFLPPLSQGRQ